MRLDGVRCSFIARFAAMSLLCFGAACATSPVFAASSVERYSPDWDRDDERDDTIESRKEAERKLQWKSPEFHRRKNESLLHVQVLGVNDFHGQLSESRRVANRPVRGAATTDLVRAESLSGESPLGNLIADAKWAALGTDFAFMNPGGIRADLAAEPVTYRQLFTIHSFSNSLARMELTGQQIYDLLNQQWVNQPFPPHPQDVGFDLCLGQQPAHR